MLTHLGQEIYLMSVIWTCHTFENNFEMEHKYTNHLTNWDISDEQIAFVREISPKLPSGFGCYRHEWHWEMGTKMLVLAGINLVNST